jgi:hypothetical protein
MSAERICLSYVDDFEVFCIRPATVCGVSPRMRFDVVVNMFVVQAFVKKQITVLGGEQVRPNIHIDDMAAVYIHFLNNVGIASGTYNAGFENISVMDIATMVRERFNVPIEVKPSNDPRSYRQDSSKLLSTGFMKKKGVTKDQLSQACNDAIAIVDNDRKTKFDTDIKAKSDSIETNNQTIILKRQQIQKLSEEITGLEQENEQTKQKISTKTYLYNNFATQLINKIKADLSGIQSFIN